MAKHPGVHWRVPTTITLAFVAGVLFAIGHHLFFASLATKPIDASTFDQQQNLAIGSAFAFLVRAALVISIGATFWQVFWRTLLNKDLKLETADQLAALLDSLIYLGSPNIWLTSPLLVLIAAIAWLIPFATIVPPATLTVRLVSHNKYDLMVLAIPDFLGTSMGRNIPEENDDGGMAMSVPTGTFHWNSYEGPTNYLMQTVIATALDGQLPKLPSPATNASYVLSYSAPSIRCEQMPQSFLSNWAPVMGCDPSLDYDGTANNFSACMSNPYGDYWWPYLSWTPGFSEYVPFSNGSLTAAADLPFTNGLDDDASPYLGMYNNTLAATLFVAASKVTGDEEPVVDWVALNCSLYNSTYTTNFTFEEGVQTVSILDVDIASPISAVFSSDQLQGNETVSPDFGIHMNYQALMDSLGRLLVGDIGNDATTDTVYTSESTMTEYQTQILQTELAFTKEIFPIYNLSELYRYEANTSKWYQRPLAEAVENLFQNMTLSLFSRNEFLRAMKSPTNVTSTTLQNVYEYNWQRLWLAYGLALGFSLLVAIVGSSSLVIAGASYSHKLSTILRVTGGDRVDVDIKESDRAGNDPLPEYLSQADLSCRARRLLGGSASDGSLRMRKSTAVETSAMIQRPVSPLGDY